MPRPIDADPIATMPAKIFSDQALFPDELIPPEVPDYPGGLASEEPYRDALPVGRTMRDAIKEDLARYRINSHEENVALGARISGMREEISTYAQAVGLDLRSAKHGSVTLDPALREQFRHLHRLSTELALGNWRLIPYCLVNVKHIEWVTDQDMDDLFQEGYQGLASAAKRYNPWHDHPKRKTVESATAFSSYAVPYIEGHIHSALGVLGPLAKGHENHAVVLYRKAKHKLTAEYQSPIEHERVVLFIRLSSILGRTPAPEELTEYRVGIESSKQKRGYFRKACAWYERIVHAYHMRNFTDHRPSSFRDNSGELVYQFGEPFEDDSIDGEGVPIEEAIEERERSQAVGEALQVLHPDVAEMMRYRFGLPPYDKDHTQVETADAFRINVDRFRAIESRTMRRLRHPLNPKSLRNLLP